MCVFWFTFVSVRVSVRVCLCVCVCVCVHAQGQNERERLGYKIKLHILMFDEWISKFNYTSISFRNRGNNFVPRIKSDTCLSGGIPTSSLFSLLSFRPSVII
jgi:hypothetical protein